jgi:DNA-binding NtrC family response regulator
MTSPSHKRKLVVLDADRRTLHDVCEAAKAWYEVLPTHDVRQAMLWLQNAGDVSVFVTEQVDAHFEGSSLLEKVRTLYPDVRRIVMTNFSDLGRIVQGLHSGSIQKVVQKPIDRQEFLMAIAPTEVHAAANAAQPSNFARAG